MSFVQKSFLLAAVLAFGFCSVSHAAQFDFTYSFPVGGVPGAVTASGTLTTTAFDPVAMDYTITGITGSRTVSGVTDAIASLLPPGSFGGNDNLLFPTSPFLDGNGFSFTLATGGGDDGFRRRQRVLQHGRGCIYGAGSTPAAESTFARSTPTRILRKCFMAVEAPQCH